MRKPIYGDLYRLDSGYNSTRHSNIIVRASADLPDYSDEYRVTCISGRWMSSYARLTAPHWIYMGNGELTALEILVWS